MNNTLHDVRRDHFGELRLYSDRVDAFIVKELFDAHGDGDVVGRTATADVRRRDDPRRR